MFDDFDMTLQCEDVNWYNYEMYYEEMVEETPTNCLDGVMESTPL